MFTSNPTHNPQPPTPTPNPNPWKKMAAILADEFFKHILLNENERIPIPISLKLVPRSPIDNNSALVQVMAWRRTGEMS